MAVVPADVVQTDAMLQHGRAGMVPVWNGMVRTVPSIRCLRHCIGRARAAGTKLAGAACYLVLQQADRAIPGSRESPYAEMRLGRATIIIIIDSL